MRRTVMNRSLAHHHHTALARPTIAALALALTFALAGCTGGGPSDAVADPIGPSAPTSLVGVECADLVSLERIRAVLGESVEAVEPLFTPGGGWPLASVALRQAGGLECEWSDSANQAGEYEALLEIIVMPNAADEWTEWFTPMSGNYRDENADGTLLWACDSSLGGSYNYCKFDAFAGGKWAAISVSNIAPDADTTAIIDQVVAALEGATSPAATWTPQPLAGLPSTCEELLPLETIRSVLGVADMDEREIPMLMPYVLNTGLEGALECSWSNPYSSALGSPLQVAVLPGASWAWDASWALPRPDYSPATAVEGLGEAAFMGCQPVDNPPCYLDILIDGAWVTLDGKGAVNEKTLAELAAIVTESLR